MNQTNKTKSRLKLLLLGGGIGGLMGAGLGWLAGLSPQGAAIGFLLGWLVGEIYGLGAAQG